MVCATEELLQMVFLISGSLNLQSKFRYVCKCFAGSRLQSDIKVTGFEKLHS